MTGPRPAPESMKELGFKRQGMTPWFSPSDLARTGIQSTLAAVFGSYADKRELQAALGDPPVQAPYEFNSDGEFWMDFVADLGDGFDSTYTIAYLLAKQELVCLDANRKALPPLPRGKILVMGGDQVYPSATRENYRDRLYGPYEAALPWCDKPHNPHLYALPGNHDWYDGLTSFMRLFCQKRWIGGWETHQTRSYFAAQLPGEWWVWGLDFQLEADLDYPQRNYFAAVASAMKEQKDPRIILCVAAPSWLHCEMGKPQAFAVLDYFLKRAVPRHATVKVTLTGDLHHYARYENQHNEHRITSGGGGAYLAATHNLPPEIEIPRSRPDEEGTWTETLTLKQVYPDKEVSKTHARRALRFLWRRDNARFALLLGALYLFFGWLLEAASGGDFVRSLAGASMREAAWLTLDLMRVSVGTSLFALVIVSGLGAFGYADNEDPRLQRKAGILGGVHGALHLLVALVAMWGLARIPGVATTPWIFLLYLVLLPALGTLLAGILMGGYLIVMNRWGMHDNAAFSSQSIADHKNFLRLRFKKDGSLTIYPIVVDRVTTAWDVSTARDKSWIVPAKGEPEPEARLAEAPIEIEGRPAVTAPESATADPMATRRG